MDIGMPLIDGYQLCSLLRKNNNFKDIPIIMLTGNTGFIDRAKAKIAGATDYMTKPFAQDDLLKIIFRYKFLFIPMLELSNFFNNTTDKNIALRLLQSDYNTQDNIGESYLKFILNDSQQISGAKCEGAIALKYIEQVLIVSAEKIIFLPNLPSYVIGLFNRRNRVYWLIELSSLLKIKTKQKNIKNYEVIIINVNTICVALAVKKVKGIIRVRKNSIISTPPDKQTISSYFNGYFLENDEHQILILNPHQIVLKNYHTR